MMEIYPYGGLWAYFKFHFIDGITKQSVMLLDKTRVDYDNKEGKGDEEKVLKSTERTDEELSTFLKGFGIGGELTKEERIKKITNELEE